MTEEKTDGGSPAGNAREAILIRALFMILFVIIYYVAQWLVMAVAVFQWVVVIVTGRQNPQLAGFGEGISRFVYQVARFLTFGSEDKPFPFAEWPGAPPSGGA